MLMICKTCQQSQVGTKKYMSQISIIDRYQAQELPCSVLTLSNGQDQLERQITQLFRQLTAEAGRHQFYIMSLAEVERIFDLIGRLVDRVRIVRMASQKSSDNLKKVKTVQAQVTQLRNMVSRLELQLQEKDEKMNKQQITNRELAQQLKRAEEKHVAFQKSLQECNQAIRLLQASKNQEIRSFEVRMTELVQQNIESKAIIVRKDQQIAKSTEVIKAKTQSNEKGKEALQKLRQKEKESSKKIKSLIEEKEKLEHTFQQLQIKNNQTATSIREKEDKISSLTASNVAIEKELKRKGEQLLINQKIGRDKAQMFDQKDEEIKKLTHKIKDIQKQLQELNTQVQVKERDRSRIELEAKASRSQIESLEFMCREKESLIVKVRSSVSALEAEKYSHLLQHDILPHFPVKGTEFICSKIEEMNKHAKIKRTKLLYTVDSSNKAKFHTQIEGKPHLVVIVKLTTERYIAAYLNMPVLKEKRYNGDQAVLLLPMEEDVFYLKEGSKAFTYDDYYLIIGNAELRIKTGDRKIFSNFGILNSFFQCRDKKVDYLLGFGENREPEVESYEMHQVIFADQKTTEYETAPNREQLLADV